MPLKQNMAGADEIEEMTYIFKQNEVLWRLNHGDYYDK
jgi:hypothetical protein